MKCMIVDDEPLATKVIASHISHIDGLEVASIHHSATEAFARLQSQPVDILFLDIQMPRMSGLSLLKSLARPPYVILTTAHREYALEGYDLDIVDYLLKPIALERFMQAIGKIYRLAQRQAPTAQPMVDTVAATTPPFIYVKVDRHHTKVLLEDIRYIESLKNHVRIVTAGQQLTPLLTISEMEEKLPQQSFLRIHRSFIVRLDQIQQYSNTNVVIGEQSIPIGRLYKNEVLKRLKSYCL